MRICGAVSAKIVVSELCEYRAGDEECLCVLNMCIALVAEGVVVIFKLCYDDHWEQGGVIELLCL